LKQKHFIETIELGMRTLVIFLGGGDIVTERSLGEVCSMARSLLGELKGVIHNLLGEV
jgi:hypothetical protein